MPLTATQNKLLHLAGTVRLPSPYPAKGKVSIVAYSGAGGSTDTVLRLTHQVSDRLVISRLFRLSDVEAIRAVWPPIGAEKVLARALKFKSEIAGLVAARFAADPTDSVWLTEASVYLPEWAGVVLQTEAAQTAAESADYYPPMGGQTSRPIPPPCDHRSEYSEKSGCD